MKETLEAMEGQDAPVTIVTGVAYSGTENERLASEKNVNMVTTNLTGRQTDDFVADFEFSEDGHDNFLLNADTFMGNNYIY